MYRQLGPSSRYRRKNGGENAILRQMRQQEGIALRYTEDSDEEETIIDPNRPLYPTWLIYVPRLDLKPSERTPYDDLDFVPHMTLNNRRPIRYPDQWPSGPVGGPNLNGPEVNKLSQRSLEEAKPLAGITSPVPLTRDEHREIYYAEPTRGHGHNRLDKQHAILTRQIDGLYYPKELVRERLRGFEVDGRQRRVLDLGTSGGNWAIDLAMEFPDVHVVGVDIGGTKPSHPVPPNCELRFNKFNDTYPHWHEQFDVVHVRSIANGVFDYYSILKEIARCLRPGGLLLLADGDFQLLQHDLTPQEICLDDPRKSRPPVYSWLGRVFFETYNFMKDRGLEVDAGIMLEPRLKKCPIWENIETRKVHVPVGKWAGSPDKDTQAKLDYCGELMKQNMKMFARALKPVMINCGVSADQYQKWLDGTDWELDHLTIKCIIRFHYAWATKKVDANIGDEEYAYPDPPPAPDPEPECDYDDEGNEIPLQYSEDEEEEETNDEVDEEEDHWRGRRQPDEDEDSAWSRSPSRSPVRKPVVQVWGEDGISEEDEDEDEDEESVTDEDDGYEGETDEQEADADDGNFEQEPYEDVDQNKLDPSHDHNDGPRQRSPEVPRALEPDWKLPPYPFQVPSDRRDVADKNSIADSVSSKSAQASDRDECGHDGIDPPDIPPAPVLMYPSHLIPGRGNDAEGDPHQHPDLEFLPYTFIDYGNNQVHSIAVPPRTIHQPDLPPPNPLGFDAQPIAGPSNCLKLVIADGPAPSPFQCLPTAPANVEVLNAARLAATLPYPNPMYFAPNPAVGWAPDPEAVAGAELRARLEEINLSREVEEGFRPKRAPIKPTAPPGGRGLHDGLAGRTRQPTPRAPGDPRSRRYMY